MRARLVSEQNSSNPATVHLPERVERAAIALQRRLLDRPPGVTFQFVHLSLLLAARLSMQPI
jgi:hypothetical protein